MSEEHLGVQFEVAEDAPIESGSYASLPPVLPITGWRCTGCGHFLQFVPPRAFAEVLDGAEAHEAACAKVPKAC